MKFRSKSKHALANGGRGRGGRLRHAGLSAGPFCTWLLPGFNIDDPELEKTVLVYTC